MADSKPRFVGDLPEDHLIEYFFAPIAEDLSDDVAGVSIPAGQQLLVSADALQEGIHFLRESPPSLIAQKALRSNASDILASGGRPRWFTLSLSMPRNLELRWLAQFSSGLKAAMNETGLLLIGGDTTAATDHISIAITVLGTVAPECRIGRRGARMGDWIGVTGTLGSASVGLDVVLGIHDLGPLEKWYWLERHFCPPYRAGFAQAVATQGLVTAMMDLSDGLFSDLPRLCKASAVGALVDLELVPTSAEARALGLTVVDAARGGEDYELLFCANSAHWSDLKDLAQRAGTTISHIGTITPAPNIIWQREGVTLETVFPVWKHFG